LPHLFYKTTILAEENKLIIKTTSLILYLP